MTGYSRALIWRALPVFVLLAALTGTVSAQSDIPLATIVHDEGGTAIITGKLTYTDLMFTRGVAQPLVILEDQAGFVDRNKYYLMSRESQVLGQFTSDFYQSPVSYSLTLPEVPRGAFRDVDHDGAPDTGVQVFAVAYWNNVFGDPYLEERDLYGGGWSTAYASTRASDDANTRMEIVGGSYVVYAPDDQQGFPSGFGADGKLFTGDDPIVRLPPGYTIVNMDSTPFTFDRSREASLDLIEPEEAALVDFSKMSYAEAFDAMIDKFRKEYAFTDYKHLDWDALAAEFRPRFEAAEREHDVRAYVEALRDFNWSIPDGHVNMNAVNYLGDEFQQQTGGGLGMAIRELDDGRVIVNYLSADSPAAQAGVQLKADILAIQNTPIDAWVSQQVPWSSPFSSEHVKRLQQLRYATRFPLGTAVEITYQNPGTAEPTTVTLTAVDEQDSFQFSLASVRVNKTGFELPVESKILPSGYGYVSINSFFDNDMLTIQLWERLMQTLNEQHTPGLIIDLRQNGGGKGFLADQMAAYFFDEPLTLGNTAFYDKSLGEFTTDARGEEHFILPPEDLRYHGDIAVLVGPNCNSACEFFAYDMTLQNRAAIVGQYPTAGLGGGIDYFIMPEGIFFQFTAGRALDADGNIHIEGKGIAPTVRVPVDETTVFSDGDPVLDAAVRHLNEVTGNLDGGVL